MSYRRRGISRKGDEVFVLGDLVKTAAHGDFFVKVIGFDVVDLIVVFFDFGVLVCTLLLALHMSVKNVLKLAFLISAITCLGEIGTLEDMTLVTTDALVTVAKHSKRTANEGTG
jgi:hypothetical protein